MTSATTFTIGTTASGATYASLDGTTDYRAAPHRIRLWRRWDTTTEAPSLMVVALNPSTATHEINDPTIRRIINHAKREGHPGIEMFNLFSLRSTCPKAMMASDRPTLIENYWEITGFAAKSKRVLCGWGNHGRHRDGDKLILGMLRKTKATLYCLGKNQNGTPKHPLYLRDDAAMVEV